MLHRNWEDAHEITESKLNENLKSDHTFNRKHLIILKTYVHHLRHRFIHQK